METTLTDRVLHENVSCASFVLISWEKNLVKMTFTEYDITAMNTELAAIRERMHKLIMFRILTYSTD